MPADRTRAQVLRQNGGFVNPYTFVPTPPRGDLTAGPGETGLGDSGADGPPSHARITAGQWSGRIRLRLTTLTPLLLPDAANRDADPAGDGRWVYDMRRDASGQPLVPPTSLKGAIRSAFEIVTASRYGIFTGQDEPLAYRVPASGDELIPAVVTERGGRKVFRCCAGDREWTASRPAQQPVQLAAWVPMYLDADDGSNVTRVGPLPAELNGARVWARVRLHQLGKTADQGLFRVWWVTHIAANKADLKPEKLGGHSDPRHPAPSLTLIPHEASRVVSGVLCVSGPSVERKRYERFFVQTPSDATIEVSERNHAFWRSVLSAYDAATEYHDPPEGLVRSWHVRHVASLMDLPAGTPVYLRCRGTGERRIVTEVHPVMIGRMPFDAAPASLLDDSVRPARTLSELSPADRTLGWVPTAADLDRYGARHSSGYRGRVAVTEVRLDGSPQKAIEPLPGDGLVLAPMSTPKPTQFRFYAASSPDGTPVADKGGKETGYRGTSGLRGRKVYRWRDMPDGYWQPTSQRDTTWNGQHREFLDPGASPTQTSRHTSWVRPRATFTAELALDGVGGAELGALLWLLSQGRTAPLRLGAGKPLGFGVVACEIDWDATALWDGAATIRGWRQLQRPDPAERSVLEQLAATFERSATSHPVLAVAVASYLAACKPVEHPVHYPRPTSEPTPTSYEWFVANERVTKEGMPNGWALPHVNDPEPRLPYLPPRDEGTGRS